MLIPKELLKEHAKSYQIVLDEKQLEKFECYANLLVEWNKNINLTAITEPEQIVIKHFLDSLLLMQCVHLKQKASIIDVGTGAGFPGIPLKIVREDIELTLLDSLNKRVSFLNHVADAMSIQARTIHARAEDGGRNPKLREKFDIATARAVAHLRELSEYCLPFVKLGGLFVALKGYEIEDELKEAQKAIKLLGGEIVEIKKFILPDDSKRGIVVIKKISQTSTKYPRISAKIAKNSII